ncbi:hypothetical protein [Streptomyces sp. G-G2]|uniref:hypothetical protein n=1 Tax=Streptomyces sp. G-G2 TaxID=3046201 RepID=UPI0024B8C2A9|nr:hypothetical protein [Streptomyces sp. G-G2]MDJ0381815.1 hypothetical protein [Streptomyces sp. G-G2]
MTGVSRVSGARAGVVAAVLLGPLLLAGCGIKPTEAIGSGSPAAVRVAAPFGLSVVYLVAPGGQLTPVPVPFVDRPAVVVPALDRLLAGPDAAAVQAGLRTELPSVDGRKTGAVQITPDGPKAVRVRVPVPIRSLSLTARRQIVCTVAFETQDPGQTAITVTGPDGPMEPTACGLGG